MAEHYGVPVILHTDHCAKKLLPWIDGLLDAGEKHFAATLLGEGFEVALPRVIDTLIGCAIAWAAVSFIWPDWRFRNLPRVVDRAMNANCRYLDAILEAVGLNDPWYNYRVGTMVHASKELNVYNALPTLFLCNDHTGASELCTLFLDPAWRKEGNGYLLSKSRFMFMAAFRDRFNEKVVAEMRGVIDDTGYSPFWESLGERFFSMEFSRAD